MLGGFSEQLGRQSNLFFNTILLALSDGNARAQHDRKRLTGTPETYILIWNSFVTLFQLWSKLSCSNHPSVPIVPIVPISFFDSLSFRPNHLSSWSWVFHHFWSLRFVHFPEIKNGQVLFLQEFAMPLGWPWLNSSPSWRRICLGLLALFSCSSLFKESSLVSVRPSGLVLATDSDIFGHKCFCGNQADVCFVFLPKGSAPFCYLREVFLTKDYLCSQIKTLRGTSIWGGPLTCVAAVLYTCISVQREALFKGATGLLHQRTPSLPLCMLAQVWRRAGRWGWGR